LPYCLVTEGEEVTPRCCSLTNNKPQFGLVEHEMDTVGVQHSDEVDDPDMPFAVIYE